MSIIHVYLGFPQALSPSCQSANLQSRVALLNTSITQLEGSKEPTAH